MSLCPLQFFLFFTLFNPFRVLSLYQVEEASMIVSNQSKTQNSGSSTMKMFVLTIITFHDGLFIYFYLLFFFFTCLHEVKILLVQLENGGGRTRKVRSVVCTPDQLTVIMYCIVVLRYIFFWGLFWWFFTYLEVGTLLSGRKWDCEVGQDL